MQSNIWKLYISGILTETLFYVPILIPFFESFGLSITQAISTEIAFAGTILFLEIPTGYFADIYGRKKSLILGALLVLIGIYLHCIGSTFLMFIIGNVFWGAGVSFLSGSREAILYDSMLEEKIENKYQKYSGDIWFYSQLSLLIACILGGFIAQKSLVLTYYFTLIPFTVCLVLFLGLKETIIHTNENKSFSFFKKIINESFIHNSKIRNFVIYAGISGLFYIDIWFKQKYLEDLGVPLAYFGIILGFGWFLSGLGAKYSEKIENIFGLKLSLISIAIIPILIWIFMGLTKSILIIPFIIIVDFFSGLTIPIFGNYVQQLISSDRRATIMSLISFFGRLIFFIFALPVSKIADYYGIFNAFLVLALISFIFSMTSFCFLRKVKII